jgi:anti-sigma factor RsiW
MTGHLSSIEINSLADGELTAEQTRGVNEHLAECPSCTADALYQTLLKAAVARAGQRYAPPAGLRERLVSLNAQDAGERRTAVRAGHRGWLGAPGWIAIAAALLISVTVVFIQRTEMQQQAASAQYAALVTEVCDQHIAALAATLPPQVLSSDRHTVKPWFQGKLPFSFNLPENLPGDTTLDGANLTYIHNQPVAQLLYSIGRHRVSMFVAAKAGRVRPGATTEHAGFHIAAFETDELEVVAVSDVDPARLSGLLHIVEEAQTGAANQAK